LGEQKGDETMGLMVAAFVLGVIGGFVLGWYVFKKAKID